ncbi:MAG: hypothetical protein M0031_01925 [Thermaerobacter sp.]|jgi:YVTN family beta-propeller protein|nr:hypothetical protein [Thermaerobacter sp.]
MRKFLPLLAGLALFLAACGAPRNAAMPSPAAAVYVFNAGNDSVSVVNPAAGAVAKTVVIGTTSRYPSATWGASSGYVLLPHAGNLAVLRLSGLQVTDNLPLPDPHGVNSTETPDGRTAILALPDEEQLLYLNLDHRRGYVGQELGSQATGKMGPAGISTDPRGGYVLVPGNFNGKNCVIDLAKLTQSATICTVGSPVPHPTLGSVSPDGRWWAVANAGSPGSITLYDVAKPRHVVQVGLVSPIQGLGAGPYFPIFTPHSRYLLALQQGSDSIAVIDPATLQVVRTIHLPGADPVYAAYSPGGRHLYVAMAKSNAVAVLEVPQLQVRGLIGVGPDPVSVVAGSYRFLPPAG